MAAETETEPTRPRSTWRKRPSQKGKPRLRLAKHAATTQRASAAARVVKRVAAAAERAARRKQKAGERAARRRQKALERVARRKQRALAKAAAAAARKKRKAVDGGGGVVGGRPVRRRLDVDGERGPPEREDPPNSCRANLMDNLRYLIELNLAGELSEEPQVKQEPPSTPPVQQEQTAELPGSTPPPTPENPPPTSTAIVAVGHNLSGAGATQVKKKPKKPTTVDKLILVPNEIQGDRKFSEWGGSVVTSVVGTFLTQNVTDNMSSNVFMTMASKFPPKNSSNVARNADSAPLLLTDGHHEQCHAHLQSTTPSPCSGCSETCVAEPEPEPEPAGDAIEHQSDASQQSEKKKKKKKKKDEKQKKKDDDLDALLSALRSGEISKWTQNDVMEVMSNSFGQSTAEKIRGKKEKEGSFTAFFLKDTSEWDSLRQEAVDRGYSKVDDDAPDMVDWEALMNAPMAGVLDCVKDRGQHSLIAFRIMAFLIRLKRDHGCIDLEWLRFIPRAKARKRAICKKVKPNCGACPFTSDCKYYKSQLGRAVLALPEFSQQYAAKEAGMDPAKLGDLIFRTSSEQMQQFLIENGQNTQGRHCSEPTVEIPPSPLNVQGEISDEDDEDELNFFDDDDDGDDIEDVARDYDMEVDLRSLNLTSNTRQAGATPGNEIIRINPQAKPTPNQRKFSLRTEYTAYVIPDDHLILSKFDPRDPDDRNPYLLVVRSFDDRYAKVTILIPSRTANRGIFPLNGTYFQENEVFSDHSSSRSPIEISRDLIVQLQLQFQTCTVHFGASIHSVTKGYICTREFDRRTKAPKPLSVNIHATNVNKDISKKRARSKSKFYSEEDSEEDW
uniref:Demeter RRM-fold domain-containing protein n=1 Tax=Oryza brachyantha TaxID=4533 RepID=J3LX04_ORYBR